MSSLSASGASRFRPRLRNKSSLTCRIQSTLTFTPSSFIFIPSQLNLLIHSFEPSLSHSHFPPSLSLSALTLTLAPLPAETYS